MVFTLIDSFVLLFVASFISKRDCWVGFQRIFFHQFQKACYIAKSKKNCLCICHWPRAHVSHIYEGEKKKKNTFLICSFRSCLLLMDLGSTTGKKEMDLLWERLGWMLKLLKSFLTSLNILNVYLCQITKTYLAFLHMYMQMYICIFLNSSRCIKILLSL